MGRYVARRLLQMIPVFIGTTLLIFLMVYALPGDPVRGLFGDKGGSPAVIASLRHQYGLDQPILVQYYHYMKDMILHFDFGTQIASGRPVTDVLSEAFPVTLRLASLSFAIEVVLGIALGIWAGMRAGRFADNAILLVSLLLISVPVFVLGFILKVVFAFQLNWLPPNVNDSTNYNELLMPAFVLATASLAYVTRLTRTSVAENLRADYIRTAIAKGLPRRRVVGVHLMRNSLIPVITYLGTDIGALMGGAVVTEGLFNIQGIGGTIYQSIVRREGTTLVGLVTILVLVYLLASLLVDLLYAVLDPRIRYA
ncbi:ABC transporter permease [Streptomyces mirabilis]|jgi:oligopeptide transport system permease protein|uniref:Peptide ABC transporter n=1 Tax=Streptomyces olivochromogenes TaxID=1963 RepID=A0A250VAJ4_STROL|nr:MULTISPECIES: ABC transporter permease [Streptomyces]KUN46237.1 ABC transporter permease [Streptomyces olivochromogenes]MCT9105733.1 ABC transporter permease [Streptomyces mirabilis]MCX4436353.1 ABC transporter permease [Streptomyces mirabilis]PBC96426.1 oligopeptide transport system permease protein [Streptomyces sp. Ag82_O1-15]SOE67192.1 oligopeptide transport system permease protein [Streptomyces sp. OV198]